MPDYFRRTAHLGFRTWKDGDLDLALGLWGDPAVTRLIDAKGQLSLGDVTRRLAEEIRCDAEHGVQYWPIFLLATEEHVGCCGVKPRDPGQRIYELGVHIGSRFWRQGLAEEAAAAIIAYAFDELGAAGLFAGHHPENEGSRRLLTKLGFRYTHHELYLATGLRHPSYMLDPPRARTVSES